MVQLNNTGGLDRQPLLDFRLEKRKKGEEMQRVVKTACRELLERLEEVVETTSWQ